MCNRWVAEKGECKYKPNHSKCGGNEELCLVVHDPFQIIIGMKRDMLRMREEGKI